MGRIGLAALTALVLPALLPATSRAQPTVRVRAETRIDLRADRAVGAVQVTGTLHDDRGQPLAGRDVTVVAVPAEGAADAVRAVVRTGEDGAFHAAMDLPLDRYMLHARFDRDELYDDIEVERELDLDRAEVSLRVDVVPATGRLDLDRPEHVVTVTAQSPEEGGANLEVSLLDELRRPLAEGRTDAAGRVRFTLPAAELGPPGPGRLSARSTADERRAAAQTEVPIVRFRRTRLDLQADRTDLAPGDTLHLSGHLRDSAGPRPDRAIGVYLGHEHLETVLTDRGGRFELEVPVDADWGNTAELKAVFRSDSPGWTDSESDPISLSVSTSPSMPWGWLLIPLAVCGLLLLALSRRAPPSPGRVTVTPEAPPLGVVGASRARWRPERTDVRGTVLDHRDDEPVDGAMVTLVSGDGAVPIPVDSAGRFAADHVKDGDWTLRVEARGYLPVEGRIRVPHRGEWSDLTVRLQSLRALALVPFRRLALALLPERRLWPLWTNREIGDRAGSRAPRPGAMEELTELVDEACYGAEPPGHGEVESIEQRAARAADDLRHRD